MQTFPPSLPVVNSIAASTPKSLLAMAVGYWLVLLPVHLAAVWDRHFPPDLGHYTGTHLAAFGAFLVATLLIEVFGVMALGIGAIALLKRVVQFVRTK